MSKRFFILILMLFAFSTLVCAQSQSVSTDSKKNTPAPTVQQDKAKTGECTGHMEAHKAECKFVDANNDGLCDTCGKKDCKEASKSGTATPSKTEGCPYQKECGKSPSCTTGKDGKK